MLDIDIDGHEDDEVRQIDAGAEPERFARGWHLIGLESQFRDGKPHQINAFGAKLVVWADTKGELNVLDSYCRHMGGDLSQGTIKGDEIACPFHDWRWGGDGRCKDIPYAKRVPMRARTQAWPTMVRNGQLFVWNDPENGEPEDYIPELAEVGSEGWTDWVWRSVLIEGANCRELIDNVVDMAHFFYVHYNQPVRFHNVFEGHVAAQDMAFKPRADMRGTTEFLDFGDEAITDSMATYYGPAYMVHRMSPQDGEQIETLLVNSHYPVTPTSFMLQYGVMLQKPEGMSEEAAVEMARQVGQMVMSGFEEDVDIWKHKTRIDNPLLSEEDGPVYQLRRWYEQFYVDRADITEDMTARFEFEVDTAKANAQWEVEMAENIAKAAAESVSG